jgi:hypothetical protein
MSNEDAQPEKGEIIPIEFGGKVIAPKRKCTCGGDVSLKDDPEGGGRIAVCSRCGATLKIG